MCSGTLEDHLVKMTVLFLVIFHKSENAPSCPEDAPLHCVEYNECYSREQRCDGRLQCADGTDEHNCHLNVFECSSMNMKFCASIHDCVSSWEECNYNCPTNTPHRCNSNNECYSNQQRCDRRYDCTDESDEFNCIVSHYKRYLSAQKGEDFKADELSITALFTIIGPVMFGVSVLLFVLKLRASFRTTSNTPAGNRGRRIDVNDIEPVLFVTGQSAEMNNYGAHLSTSHV